ncbi:MAG: hypothetical protein L0287_01070, partial [Anaerolineae bacterium]|nr:hypothetical protein [Anaerolineae bacterium]
MKTKSLPTGLYVMLMLTVLLVLVCAGAAGFVGPESFCDYLPKDVLWEQEGIRCPGWSPYEPTTLNVCSESDETVFDEWLNQTTNYGPQYCEQNSENADSLGSQSDSEENGTFGLPEVIPLEGTPEGVFQNESFNENSGTIEIFTNGIPEIINNECVSKTQLMIVFEFENPVQGEYELFVNDVPYEITPVGGRP